MSRFIDFDDWDDDAVLRYGRWMGRVKKVLEGKPGQAALKELEAALLALPHKRLIEGSLCDGTGVCAMGAWAYKHYRDQGLLPREVWEMLRKHDPYEEDGRLERTITFGVKELGITETLAELVALTNDEDWVARTPEQRWEKMLKWVRRHIKAEPGPEQQVSAEEAKS